MAKRRDYVPHVVALNGGAESKCLHCGEELFLVLPMKVSVWCAAANAFVDAHKRCKPTPARSSGNTSGTPNGSNSPEIPDGSSSPETPDSSWEETR